MESISIIRGDFLHLL